MTCLYMHSFLRGFISGPDTTPLIRTDIILGVIVLLCVTIATAVLTCEIMHRRRERKSRLHLDHSDMSETGDQPDEKDLYPGRIPSTSTAAGKHTK